MAVPRNRTSNSKKNMKRSHHAKKPKTLTACMGCGSMRRPHAICLSCGRYGDKTYIAKEQA
ncbi:50S ribosomal protein L32 [Simkania negevensis]|uniref:Large ribosomal subunit protein bL32 n=1 Tax=Simkania negevensis TaxID=83561 RepID=A0ABS3AQ06_9BACT|nr:50S ribosomal protein L32 [Simkania negevensis]